MKRNKWRRISIIPLMVLYLFLSGIAFGEIPSQEREALISLYNNTGGDNWKNNSGWKTPPLDADGFALPGTETDWNGITTAEIDGQEHVTVISLGANGLNGTLPAELGNLYQLKQLVLYKNRLNGTIPTALGNLDRLQNIFLYDNQLSGSIPAELGNISQLKSLYLYKNNLTGSIPALLGTLPNLERLYLQTNQLDGDIPRQLGNLLKLKYLNLSGNQLSGSIPAELGSLGQLIELMLNGNLLSGPIPEALGSLGQLKTLHLSDNQLDGTIPAALGSLVNLENLYLYNNQLTGDIPDQLGNLWALKIIHLGENQLTGGVPTWLGSLTNLVKIQLNDNQLQGAIPATLGTLGNLQRLYLDKNLLSGSIPTELGSLSNLNFLNLSENQLTGSIPPALGSLGQLESLVLGKNQLTGSIPAELGNLIKLNYFYLAYNQLSGSIPANLGKLVNLKYFIANNNSLSDEIPGEVGNLANLFMLYLQNNKLSGEIPVELMNLGKLSRLNLCYNNLYSTDAGLRAWLDAKVPGWEDCLTAPDPAMTITSPNGGETWEVGADRFITWDSIGNVLEVKIEYSTDGGANWMTIEPAMENVGSYAWLVPDTPSADIRVRVSDAADGTVSDESDGAFNVVKSGITVLSPNGGESFEVEAAQTIFWKAAGMVDSVKIEYSIDGGRSWTTIATTAVAPGEDSYDWTIPGTPSDRCLVRVSDAADGTPVDVSDNMFSIEESTITVTSPNGGEVWGSCSSQRITWETTGTVGPVKIEYTVNGASWITLTNSTTNDGTYTRTLPNIESNKFKVRISEASDGFPSDTSDGTSTIDRPTITVTSPGGGDEWEPGKSYRIRWTTTGPVDKVRIYYSANNGSTWSTITYSTSNDGVYSWPAPAVTGETEYRIKVSSGCIYDISDSFKVGPPSIIVTSPNGKEVWGGGSTHPITWESLCVETVNLYYSTNNGQSWEFIASAPDSPKRYEWEVPELCSDKSLVRVQDASNAALSDQSNAVFKINHPSLSLLSPNGGEVLDSGAIKKITWTSECIDTVTLSYSSDNGASWHTIVTDLGSPGSFDWQVPDVCTKAALVKVSGGGLTDQSNSVFDIGRPSLTLLSPNGGEVLDGGAIKKITWTSECIDTVTLSYSSDNGVSWHTIVTDLGSPGSFDWQVPDVCTKAALVKVSGGGLTDQSNSVFDIGRPSLTLLSPNGGEVLDGGAIKKITWTSECIDTVTLSYSSDNGASWHTIVTDLGSPGSFDWQVPDVCIKAALVKVSGGGLTDQSNSAFEIKNPSLTLHSPNGGEVLDSGAIKRITWTSECIDTVSLSYSSDNGASWHTIVTDLGSPGSFDWQLPDVCTKAAIVKVSGEGLTAQSNSVFEIKNSSLTLHSPNGGEVLVKGSTHPITWTSECIDTVTISYSINGGQTWDPIGTASGSAGSFDWSVPDVCSKTAIVKVSGEGLSDQSDSVFDIGRPSLILLSPNGGEVWDSGSIQTISWTSECLGSTTVNIAYSTNNGATWQSIATVSSAAGNNYPWTVPAICSSNCVVKVSSGGVSDQSDTVFEISHQTLSLTSLNGGEELNSGSSYNITWDSECIDAVTLSYSTNNGVSWKTIGTASGSAGSFDWQVPDVCTKAALVKVSGEGLTDQSNSAFDIGRPSLTLHSPNGGEVLDKDTTKQITWTSECIDTVTLSYSTDSGQTWAPIGTASGSAGSFNWQVPNVCTKNALVKVSGEGLTDQSNSAFEIKNPSLTLLSPNGGEVLDSGAIKKISWTSECIDTVTLSYSSDNGASWHTIVTDLGSPGSFDWQVPDACTKNALVKVSGEGLTDQSDSVFDIGIPSLTLLSPNGGEVLDKSSAHTITWTSECIDTVSLTYSIDGGQTWNPIGTASGSAGSFDWSVPNVCTKTALVKVSGEGLSDQSDSVFDIGIPSLTLLSPNGGEVLDSRATHNITWTAECIDTVTLSYSIDGGQTWEPIGTAPGDDGSFNWPVPDVCSQSTLVKVSGGGLTDQSDSVFSLDHRDITVISPNGGEGFTAGGGVTITWNATGCVENVKIEYSADKDGIWKIINSSVPAADGSAIWSIPSDIENGPAFKIRISDVSDATVSDTIDNSIAIFITEVRITVTSPNGGEYWQSGSIKKITWDTTGEVEYVNIEYSTDLGIHWAPIVSSAPNTGIYSWQVNSTPTHPVSNPDGVFTGSWEDCVIRVSDVSSPAVADMSNNAFEIGIDSPTPTITVTSPNGGEVWETNTSYNITWTSTGLLENVKIECSYTSGGTWVTLEESTPNDGVYSWTPRIAALDPGATFFVRISDASDPSVFDVGNAGATIISSIKSITVTHPNGGESYDSASYPRLVTWKTSGIIDNVKIEYTTGYGGWRTVVSSTPNDKNYTWYLPRRVNSSLCRIRISDASDATVTDSSDSTFTIYDSEYDDPFGPIVEIK